MGQVGRVAHFDYLSLCAPAMSYSTVFGDDCKEMQTTSTTKYTAVQKVEPYNPFDFLWNTANQMYNHFQRIWGNTTLGWHPDLVWTILKPQHKSRVQAVWSPEITPSTLVMTRDGITEAPEWPKTGVSAKLSWELGVFKKDVIPTSTLGI